MNNRVRLQLENTVQPRVGTVTGVYDDLPEYTAVARGGVKARGPHTMVAPAPSFGRAETAIVYVIG